MVITKSNLNGLLPSERVSFCYGTPERTQGAMTHVKRLR
jgi:hypothetical protein